MEHRQERRRHGRRAGEMSVVEREAEHLRRIQAALRELPVVAPVPEPVLCVLPEQVTHFSAFKPVETTVPLSKPNPIRKLCLDCGMPKLLKEFRQQLESPDGHAVICKLCRRNYWDEQRTEQYQKVQRRKAQHEAVDIRVRVKSGRSSREGLRVSSAADVRRIAGRG
jgi:hypothetical protein